MTLEEPLVDQADTPGPAKMFDEHRARLEDWVRRHMDLALAARFKAEDIVSEAFRKWCAELYKPPNGRPATPAGLHQTVWECLLEKVITVHGTHLAAWAKKRQDRAFAAKFDPADIVQEAYLCCSRRLHHFERSNMDLLGWVFRNFRQQLIDAARFWKAQGRDPAREQPLPEGSSGPKELARSASTPSKVLAREERRAHVRRMVDELSPISREILVLLYYQGNRPPFAEVACTLGITNGAARQRYFRALDELLTKWTKQYPNEPLEL